MTNAIILWAEKEIGILKNDAEDVKPSFLAWIHNFIAGISPVIKKAAEDAVLAAVSMPGSGAVKAAAAFAAASADLITQGIPVVENDLKAAIQISYKALPASVTGSLAAQTVEAKAEAAVDDAAAKLTAKVSV